jgi:carbon monoxide dehydrogenase subunit G
MWLEHSFTVPVPVERAWQVLLELPLIAPCMPGATLTGVEGDTFTGTVKVKLGPISLTYQGKGRFVERDETDHLVIIEASGKDTRSAGTAAAKVTATLTADGDKTRVDVITDLTVTGRPAQFGRGMIADVGAKLIGQFADCVATTLTAAEEVTLSLVEAAPSPAGAAPSPTGAAPEAASSPARAPSSQAESASSPAGGSPRAEPPPAAVALRPVSETAPVTEAEPIDLLRLTGSTATARRLAGYAAGVVLLASLTWVTVRWLRR